MPNIDYFIAGVGGLIGGGGAHPTAKAVKRKAAKGGPVVMYDSVTVDAIPADAKAVLGYVNGYWPTYTTLLKRFPNAHVLGLTIDYECDAEGIDCELGDATSEQTIVWALRAVAREPRPVIYREASGVGSLLDGLQRVGIHRTAIRLLSAHYTAKAHICSPRSCGYPEADGTQWTQTALGRNLDQSQLSPSFWA